MKKYKLLKDLPRAKAGTIVCITNAHSNSPWIVKINKWNEDEQQRPRLAYIHQWEIPKWLEEIREPKSVWGLKEGYDITGFEFPMQQIEKNILDTVLRCLEIGNIFLTIEEAEKELVKRQAIAKILKYCWENNIDNSWKENDYEVRYYFCLSLEEEQVEFFYPRDDQKPYSPIGYFSWNDAKKILNTFPKELKSIYS